MSPHNNNLKLSNGTGRSLACEQLEDRRLLAGNVSAVKAGSVLVLTGDDLANEVGVFRSAPGVIGVAGNATNINGSASTKTFTGINSIMADLRGGDDRLGLASSLAAIQNLILGGGSAADRLNLTGNVQIFAGGGNDTIGLAVGLGGSLLIDLGAGNDTAGIAHSNIAGSVQVLGQHGNDTIAMRNSSTSAVVFNGGVGNDELLLIDSTVKFNVAIHGFDGTDSVTVSGVSAHDLLIDLGNGSDLLAVQGVNLRGSLIVLGGLGNDSIVIDGGNNGGDMQLAEAENGVTASQIAFDLIINAGLGSNQIYVGAAEVNEDDEEGGDEEDLEENRVSTVATQSVQNVIVRRNVNILGGELSDTVRVNNLSGAKNFSLETAGGDDSVQLFNVHAADLIFASLGAGNDSLSVLGIKTKKAIWLGGIGTDAFLAGGGNVIGKVQRKEFENIGTIT